MVVTNGNSKGLASVQGEIASIDRQYGAGLGAYRSYFLKQEDAGILAKGKGKKLSEIFRDTEKDTTITEGLSQRYGSALARETVVEPASQSRLDKKAADEVRSQINRLNQRQTLIDKAKTAVYSFSSFDAFTLAMLDAIYMGNAIAEIDWANDGNRNYVRQIWNRDQSRFLFSPVDGGHELRLLTSTSIFEGEALPPRKFLVHSVGSKIGNPFGEGLSERLFWWVWFKRQNLKAWLVFGDRYGSPMLKGTYRNEKDKNKLLEIMHNVAQQSGVALPDGVTLEMMQAAGSSTSTYEDLCKYCDAQITAAILLQNLTTNVEGGSFAAAETHFAVKAELTDHDTNLLTSGPFNDLASWIVELNFGIDATPPLVWKPRVETLNQIRVQRDAALVALVGKPLSNSYISQFYDVIFMSPEEIAKEQQAQSAIAPQDNNLPFAFAEGVDPISLVEKLVTSSASTAETEAMVDLLLARR